MYLILLTVWPDTLIKKLPNVWLDFPQNVIFMECKKSPNLVTLTIGQCELKNTKKIYFFEQKYIHSSWKICFWTVTSMNLLELILERKRTAFWSEKIFLMRILWKIDFTLDWRKRIRKEDREMASVPKVKYPS